MSPKIEIFNYSSSNAGSFPVLWEVMTEIGAAAGTGGRGDDGSVDDRRDVEVSNVLSAQETAKTFEAGREQGMREALDEAVETQKALLRAEENKRAEQAAHLACQLGTERDQFLQNVEREVVKLALAIAARILRREAQVDPLFLIGAVRVALGQLAETTKVKLRVAAPEAELWTETIAHLPNLKTIPLVVSDDRMQPGECVIETEMGSVDLGLNAQLSQAERTLFHRSGEKTPDNKTNVMRNHEALP